MRPRPTRTPEATHTRGEVTLRAIVLPDAWDENLQETADGTADQITEAIETLRSYGYQDVTLRPGISMARTRICRNCRSDHSEGGCDKPDFDTVQYYEIEEVPE